jgi:ParB family transcriptional regulator, chromosome partitioning protein
MAVETRKGSGGLGRGLAALIPSSAPGLSPIRDLPVASIRPHPDQPRRTFDRDELQQLADSIAEHGLLQPIIVVEAGEHYTLVAGERRLRAAVMAGHETIAAIVRNANEEEQLEVALVENIQRSDLNALEEAHAYQHLIDAFGLTQERVAERVGRSRPSVSNTLRILSTAPEVQQAIADGEISGGHARALAGLDNHTQQRALLSTIVARALSVRQTESLVASARGSDTARPRRNQRRVDPDVQHLETQVREALGTKVTITPGRRGGRITINWYDHDDLGRLVDRLCAPDR